MKSRIVTFPLFSAFALAFLPAMAPSTYTVTLVNGGPMPLSPGVIYARAGQMAAVSLGQEATPGFVQLCQTGNPAARIQELRQDPLVRGAELTAGPILPGEQRSFDIAITGEDTSVHVETMYGKTKDTCAVASAGAHVLMGLQKHVISQYVGRDEALQSGAFENPALPSAGDSASICPGASDAVGCLRTLAPPSASGMRIRAFAPYLPSVLTALESRFGAADVQSLNLPSGGAVQVRVQLKH